MKFKLALFMKTLRINRSLLPFIVVLMSLSNVQATSQQVPHNAKPTAINSSLWSWKLLSHSLYQSKVAIFYENRMVRQYLVGCNLASDSVDSESDEASKIEKVISNNNRTGLLLITCISGAHSKLIEIYDPTILDDNPVFSKFGAYSAGWEKRNGQLFVYYDRACQPSSKNCHQFETIEIEWPKE